MGIRDDATRRKLLQTRKLDLKLAVDICKSSEAATKQLRTISHPEEVRSVNYGRERQSRRESSPPSRRHRSPPDTQLSRYRASTPGRSACQFCNRHHDSNKTACPAYGKTCRICSKRNHFASVCRSKDNAVYELQDGDDDGNILALDDTRKSRLFSRMKVGGKVVHSLLDPGATVNLLPILLVKQLGSKSKITRIRSAEATLRMFDNSVLKTEGMTTLPVTLLLTGQRKILDFYVSTSHTQPTTVGNRGMSTFRDTTY